MIMGIPIQFDPFSFALNAVLVIIMAVELYVAREERRQAKSKQTTTHGFHTIPEHVQLAACK